MTLANIYGSSPKIAGINVRNKKGSLRAFLSKPEALINSIVF